MKLVISTLPIDWQRQSNFLFNVIKFCTEGQPEINIISKVDLPKDDFSNEYLSRQLNLFKRPYLFEIVNDIDSINMDDCLFKTLIFDNSWNESEIDYFCEKNAKSIYNKNIRILHYFNYNTLEDPVYKLTVHSAFQQVDLIEEGVLIALERKTPDDKTKYSFDSSLLATFEAVSLLKENNILNKELASKIVEYGKHRLLNDGSYDSMLVASSEFYYVWNACLDNVEEDNQFKKLENYLIKEIKSKQSAITYSEKAQLLLSLDGSRVLTDKLKISMLSSVFNEIKNVNQYNIFNYNIANSWSILSNHFAFMIDKKIVSKSEIEDLALDVLRLLGNFKTDCKIVVLSNHVIALVNLLKNQIINESNSLQIIYKLLFTGISKIYDSKDGLLWNEDIYSSCCALKALKTFSHLSTYPIDEILVLSQPNSLIYSSERKDNKDFSLMLKSIEEQTDELIKTKIDLKNVINENNELNQTIQKQNSAIAEMSEDLNKANEKLSKANKLVKLKHFIDFAGRISILVLLFFIVQMIYVAINYKEAFINYFTSFNGFLSWVLVGISSIMTVVSFIRLIIRKKK